LRRRIDARLCPGRWWPRRVWSYGFLAKSLDAAGNAGTDQRRLFKTAFRPRSRRLRKRRPSMGRRHAARTAASCRARRRIAPGHSFLSARRERRALDAAALGPLFPRSPEARPPPQIDACARPAKWGT
jgi:hypothetical protein